MTTNRSLGAVSRQALHQRKADAVLAAEAIALPAPDAGWLTETVEAYHAYAEAEVARLLRAEDVAQVRRLFRNLDRLARVEAQVDAALDAGESTRSVDELVRVARGLDSMVQRSLTSLGIGPRERVNLGLLEAQGMRAAAEVEDEFDRPLRRD